MDPSTGNECPRSDWMPPLAACSWTLSQSPESGAREGHKWGVNICFQPHYLDIMTLFKIKQLLRPEGVKLLMTAAVRALLSGLIVLPFHASLTSNQILLSTAVQQRGPSSGTATENTDPEERWSRADRRSQTFRLLTERRQTGDQQRLQRICCI